MNVRGCEGFRASSILLGLVSVNGRPCTQCVCVCCSSSSSIKKIK